MEMLFYTPQKEGQDFYGKIYDLRSFVLISNLSQFMRYFPPLALFKFYLSLPSPPFETHFDPLSSTDFLPFLYHHLHTVFL